MSYNQKILNFIGRAAKEGWRELELRGNQLTTLPLQITELTNLTGLDLRGNQLTSLPTEIVKLTNLSGLSL